MSEKNIFKKKFKEKEFFFLWFLQPTFTYCEKPRISGQVNLWEVKIIHKVSYCCYLLLVHSAQLGSQNSTLTVVRLGKFECNRWKPHGRQVHLNPFSNTFLSIIGSPNSPHVIFRLKRLQKCHKNDNHGFLFLWPNQALCTVAT